MSTEQTKTPASNKTIFGPLGKYAIVAVFIVSIIVTTAIMLERQLGTTEERLATIQAELHIAENYQKNTEQTLTEQTIASDSDVDTNTENTKSIATINSETQTIVASNTADNNQDTVAHTAETSPVGETVVSETPVTTSSTPVVKTVTSEATTQKVATQVVTQATTSSQPVITTTAEAAVAPKATENATTRQANVKAVHKNLSSEQRIAQMKARQEKINAEHQARIAAIKTKQKATLTAMFKRIEALEAKQTNAYASSQDRQIAALRKQLQHQQEIIDSLIVRNSEMLNTRKVNVERIQQRRRAVLNRI